MRTSLVLVAIGMLLMGGTAEARKRHRAHGQKGHVASKVERARAADERLRQADRNGLTQLAELRTTRELSIPQDAPIRGLHEQADDAEVPPGLERR